MKYTYSRLMSRDDIVTLSGKYTCDSPDNYIAEDFALNPRCSNMMIYEAPMFAFGAPDDEIYAKYKSFGVIGSHFLSPLEWLPNAKTVISFFLPYTTRIRAANATDNRWPSDEWLHGRYEGQLFVAQLLKYLVKTISESGFHALAPAIDPRFTIGSAEADLKFTSNWSERHIAYACGLGTFGLTKGIITQKGACGRLGSVLTTLDLPKDSRQYESIYEYCTMCGVCVDRCPVSAISIEEGKNSALCSDFLDEVRKKHSPRFGCGKCQVGVPCESGIPG